MNTNIKKILVHVGIISLSAVLLLLFVFYIWFPFITNHNNTLAVPDVVGSSLEEAKQLLEENDLRYEVMADSGYSSKFPSKSILIQNPKAFSEVKYNRKIYLVLNSSHAPQIEMPKVQDLSLKSVLSVLKSNGLKIGKITFVADKFFGVVHNAYIKNKLLKPGNVVPIGAHIDLRVGNGNGKVTIKMPNLMSVDIEAAKNEIIGKGLAVGTVKSTSQDYYLTQKKSLDTLNIEFKKIRLQNKQIQNQYPEVDTELSPGSKVNLWIYIQDSLINKDSI